MVKITINIIFNDKPLSVENTASLQEILEKMSLTVPAFAIAVNRRFVPKSKYATTLLQAGDRVEVITPMQGG